jgi:hypothetical protein
MVALVDEDLEDAPVLAGAPVRKDPVDLVVLAVRREEMDVPVPVVALVREVLAALVVPRDAPVRKEEMVALVPVVVPVREVIADPVDLAVLRDAPVRREEMDVPVPAVALVREVLAVPVVPVVLRDALVDEDPVVALVPEVVPGRRDHVDPVDLVVSEDTADLVVPVDLRVAPVREVEMVALVPVVVPVREVEMVAPVDEDLAVPAVLVVSEEETDVPVREVKMDALVLEVLEDLEVAPERLNVLSSDWSVLMPLRTRKELLWLKQSLIRLLMFNLRNSRDGASTSLVLAPAPALVLAHTLHPPLKMMSSFAPAACTPFSIRVLDRSILLPPAEIPSTA